MHLSISLDVVMGYIHYTVVVYGVPLNGYNSDTYFKGLNMFLGHINIPTFRFSPSKIFLQLLVLEKNFIFTFGPSFKINSYVKFIFLNEILQKNS